MLPTTRQLNCLLWAFDRNGSVNPDMFYTIAEHEGIDFEGMTDEEQVGVLRLLQRTAFNRSCGQPALMGV